MMLVSRLVVGAFTVSKISAAAAFVVPVPAAGVACGDQCSRFFRSSTLLNMAPKPGVATLDELTEHVRAAGEKLVVVDVRNPDASKEPGDQKSLAVAPVPDPSNGIRPSGLHLIWDRESASMPLPPDSVAMDTPLITHCGGGGRGQKAKDFLESKGYTNVLNGAGPKETELWSLYGEK